MEIKNQVKMFSSVQEGSVLFAGGGILYPIKMGRFQVCILSRRNLYLFTCRFLFLFLSGNITLKVIIHYFHNYLFNLNNLINVHFEKPVCLLFLKYPCSPLSLQLEQWKIDNEHQSLILVRYAREPRDPE